MTSKIALMFSLAAVVFSLLAFKHSLKEYRIENRTTVVGYTIETFQHKSVRRAADTILVLNSGRIVDCDIVEAHTAFITYGNMKAPEPYYLCKVARYENRAFLEVKS
jgi:hypothetical protein